MDFTTFRNTITALKVRKALDGSFWGFVLYICESEGRCNMEKILRENINCKEKGNERVACEIIEE